MGDNTIRTAVDLLFKQLYNLLSTVGLKQLSSGSHDDSEERSFTAKQQRRTAETTLCDFLVFLRRVSCSVMVRSRMACKQWVILLMDIIRVPIKYGKHNPYTLRTRMLTLQLLENVLPACPDQNEGELMEMVGCPYKTTASVF